MDIRLKVLYDIDREFARFLERFGVDPSHPDARESYERWRIERLLAAEETARVKAEAKAEGKAEAKNERDMEIALKALKRAKSDDDKPDIIEYLRYLGIPAKTVKTARNKVIAERKLEFN